MGRGGAGSPQTGAQQKGQVLSRAGLRWFQQKGQVLSGGFQVVSTEGRRGWKGPGEGVWETEWGGMNTCHLHICFVEYGVRV